MFLSYLKSSLDKSNLMRLKTSIHYCDLQDFLASSTIVVYISSNIFTPISSTTWVMAAYSALTFLSQILDYILETNIKCDRVSLDPDQIVSLRERVIYLQQCLPNTSNKTRRNREAMEILEAKIREVAFQAEDLMAGALYTELELFSRIYTPRFALFPLLVLLLLLLYT